MIRDSAANGLPLRLLRVSLLFASLIGYSALRVPVPGVNEPHYLGKARHYWQSDWCAGDLFLESADAHQFFYQTVGWLTAVCSLERAAWYGRVLTLLLLALGWDRFITSLTGTRFGPLWSAWVFLLLHAIGNLSGEWLVGGVEAKGFSYAFVFWGFGCLLRRQMTAAAAALGLAISMHPVVGIWSLIAGVAATVATAHTDPDPYSEKLVQSLWSWRGIRASAVLVLLSLPGLVPAFQSLLASDPDLARRANLIQFTHRLSHHLDPLAFNPASYGYYGAMIGGWLIMRRLVSRTSNWRWLEWLVAAAVLVAIAGWLIALGPRPARLMPLSEVRIWLLKFYPFRLADVLVPLLVSVLSVRLVEGLKPQSVSTFRWSCACFAAFGAVYVAATTLPGDDRNPGRMDHDTERRWLDVCKWIRSETPRDSLVYAVSENWAVKWYAQRPEYVSFKDCPQDPAGIVEWYRRQRLLSDWSRRAFADDAADAAELAELHELTGISYLVSRKLDGVQNLPVYHNETFFVYDLVHAEQTEANHMK